MRVLLAALALAAALPSSPAAMAMQRGSIGANAGTVSRPNMDDAGRVYDELRATPLAERAAAINALPGEMKAAVWRRHLLTTLAEHPDFTQEQRAIIDRTLTLITADFFDIPSSDPRWRELVRDPLQELSIQAKRAFGPILAREIFVDLGPDVSPTGTGGAASPPPAPSKSVTRRSRSMSSGFLNARAARPRLVRHVRPRFLLLRADHVLADGEGLRLAPAIGLHGNLCNEAGRRVISLQALRSQRTAQSQRHTTTARRAP